MHEEDDEEDRDDRDGDCPSCGYYKCRCCIDCRAAPGQEHALGCLGAIEP